jgi:branched-chain amino acid transport system ATP-binding protein
MTAILATNGASKTFGGLAAVADVSLEVEEGDIHCLIGPNGAGKSTLFRLIVGSYPPTAGRIAFRGTDVTAERPYQRVKRGMSIKMQTPSVFKELPVRQNIHVALQHHVARAGLSAEEDRLLHHCCICSTCSEMRTSSRANCRTASSNGWKSAWRWR